nr:neprilysin-4-like [Salvelinus alpinus]
MCPLLIPFLSPSLSSSPNYILSLNPSHYPSLIPFPSLGPSLRPYPSLIPFLVPSHYPSRIAFLSPSTYPSPIPFLSPSPYPSHELGSTGRERGRTERETGKDIREKVPADRMPDRLLTMREILETEDHSSPGNSAKQKACMFYRSCMDTGPTETAGPEPFLRLVHKLGGWAVSGQWNQTDFNSTLSLLMRDYGTFPFFSVYVGKDPNDTQGDKRYIQVS